MVLSDGNAVIYQHKLFRRTVKNRPPDPSEICALDFKREFRRSAISSVSATIDIDWSIFDIRRDRGDQPSKTGRGSFGDEPGTGCRARIPRASDRDAS
jgi:hypothetical protein